MDRLKRLEINKLFYELEFIRSDYEYKYELIQEIDKQFIESVNNIVESHPELREIYKHRVEKNVQVSALEKQDPIETDSEKLEESDFTHSDIHKNPKIKNIYRNIVKKTHPDKVGNSELNSIYIDSTKYYEQDDLLSLYKLCDKLGIGYELEENDYFLIQTNIDQIKEKIRFLECTFTWLWFNSDGSKKDEIVLDFIKLQII